MPSSAPLPVATDSNKALGWPTAPFDDPMTVGAQLTATVVAAFGRRGILDYCGERRAYIVKGRQLRVVCGDRVIFTQPRGSTEMLITEILERTNSLARSGQYDDEVLAANLTQLLVVCAPQPVPDLFLLDRYFCASELMGCRSAVVWNKADLAPLPSGLLDEFRNLGYPVIAVSARTAAGVAGVLQLLANNASVLVGQSGVGKSSLINVLAPGAQAVIGDLSLSGQIGTHTTTAVLMYDLAGGGRLVDTPGVRNFMPAFGPQRIDHGFPELRELSAGCRFTDCRHLQEPGCAVKDAIGSDGLSARRYASYQRLMQMNAERAL